MAPRRPYLVNALEGRNASPAPLRWRAATPGPNAPPAAPAGRLTAGIGGSVPTDKRPTLFDKSGYTIADRMADLLGMGPDQTSKPITYDPANQDPTMSTGEDMARSATSAALRAGTGMAGQYGNARNMVSDAFGWAVNRLAGGDAKGDRPAQDWARRITGDVPVVGQLPDSAPFDAQVQHTTGAYHQPQTEAGKWSAFVAGMWPNAALGGGGAVARLAQMAVPGTAAYAGDRLAPEGYKAPASMLAAILASMGTGAVTGGSPPEARLLADKTPEMTPPQQQAVIETMQRGQDMGLQPTLTEAIDHNVPGARSTLLQQHVEGMPDGVQTLGPRMAARPDQMRTIVGRIADMLSPETSPTTLEPTARNAAEAAIADTRGQVNAPAQPYYDALRGETVPPAQWDTLRQSPVFQQGLADLRGNPVLNASVATLPDNSLAVVNEVLKRVGARQTTATPVPGNPYGDATLQGAYEHGAGQINGQMRGLSPNWATARDTVALGRQNLLTPAQTGPLGDIAGRPGQPAPQLSSMFDSLFPSKPFEGQPNATADALAAMDYQQPGVGGQMVRSFLQRQAAESAQNVAGKPNTFAPSNFSTNVGGNPLQREVLVNAADQSNPAAGTALADALDNFDATGRRQAAGSNTVDKNAVAATVEKGGALTNAVIGGGSKRLILDRLTGWWDELQVRANQRAVVDAVNADPARAANILQQIEAARGNTALQRSLLAGLVAGSASSGRVSQ